MMRRGLMVAALIGVLALVAPSVGVAQEQEGPTVVDITGLAGPLPPADGADVQLEAEAIGEALRAPDGKRWVNLGADSTAIGVVMTVEMADRIETYGGYKRTGDIVRVEGTFQRACDEHGGDRDVHADSVEIVTPGSDRDHPIGWWKLVVALAAAAVGGVQIVRARRRRPY